MSVKVMALVFEADLPPNEQAVLLACADHAEDDGTRVYPSVPRLAYKTQRDETTVRRALRRLERRAILLADKRGGHGPHDTTVYRILIENIPLKPPFEEWCALRKAGSVPPLEATQHENGEGGQRAPHKAGSVPPIRRANGTPKGGSVPANPSREPSLEPSREPPRARARAELSPPVSVSVSPDRLVAAFELAAAPAEPERAPDPSPPPPPAAPAPPAPRPPRASRSAAVALPDSPCEEWMLWRDLLAGLYIPDSMKANFFRPCKLFRMPDDSWLLVAPSRYSAEMVSRHHDTLSRALDARLRRPVQLVIRSKEQAPSGSPVIVQAGAGRGRAIGEVLV